MGTVCTQTAPSTMALLLFTVTVALALALTDARPQEGIPDPTNNDLCRCYNPFEGFSYERDGEKDFLCSKYGSCYVKPTAVCSNKRPTASGTRYQSDQPCDATLP